MKGKGADIGQELILVEIVGYILFIDFILRKKHFKRSLEYINLVCDQPFYCD